MAPRLRFVLFCAIVLLLPAALMATGDPKLADSGKLFMILSPGVAGLALNGLGNRGERVRWAGVFAAPGVTLLVAGGALAASLAAGGARMDGAPMTSPVAAVALGTTLLTSVLEELGWAGGGLVLAVKAFGRRFGVLILGSVWAAWHLGPALLKVGLFPELEAAPPAMLAAFFVACLVYRELLTLFVERSRTWIAAAAGHAAPNVLLVAAMSSGLTLLDRPQDWPWFPAPGGLVFPLLAGAAVWRLSRRAGHPE